jgi:membrane protein implicated in regulation of membrane protease activity
MSILLLFFCGALMLGGIGLVYTRHLLLALIPLFVMLLLIAVTGLMVMAEIGMVAVLGLCWRWADQHPEKKDEKAKEKAPPPA